MRPEVWQNGRITFFIPSFTHRRVDSETVHSGRLCGSQLNCIQR